MEESGTIGGIDDIELALRQLHFMQGDIPENKRRDITAWSRARRYWIDEIILALQGELKEFADNPDEQPLRYAYAAFALLAQLVSKEFMAALSEVLAGTCPGPLVFAPAHWAWSEMNRGYGAEPVREIEDWERRIWCEEKGMLPRELTTQERQGDRPDFFLRRHVAFDRIQLTIDPFTPVEVAVKRMRMLLEKRQAEHLQEIRAAEERDISAFRAGWKLHGIETNDEAEYIDQVVMRERRTYDFARSFEGNKRVRGGETTFSIWLRALRIYDLMQNKDCGWQEVARSDETYADPEAESTKRDIYRYKRRAGQLIDAAWAGVPLAAVKLT